MATKVNETTPGIIFKRYSPEADLIGSGVYKFKPYAASEPGDTGTFQYQVTSVSSMKGGDLIVTINNGLGDSTTTRYSSGMDSTERVVIGKGATMDLEWDGPDSSSTFSVSVNGGSDSLYFDTATINLNIGDIIAISADAQCLTGSAMIMLDNGTEKRLDELTINDKILGYNPDTLELVSQEIKACANDETHIDNHFIRYYFSDGKYVDVVKKHSFYNSDIGDMAVINYWKRGMHARTIEGTTPELVKVERINKPVRYYTIFTEYQNYFVNGLLSGNRFTEKLFFDLYKR